MKTPLATRPLGTPKILLVDDNPHGLVVRKALLEEVGFAVQIASNGEEGLDLFTASAFDVVVTDFRMPGMNGRELIQKIRKHNPNARIILLSGFVEPLGLTEQTTGANVVLAKNAKEATQLVRSVRRLLKQTTPRKPPGSQMSASRAPYRVKDR